MGGTLLHVKPPVSAPSDGEEFFWFSLSRCAILILYSGGTDWTPEGALSAGFLTDVFLFGKDTCLICR